jgi:hypothetical protein
MQNLIIKTVKYVRVEETTARICLERVKVNGKVVPVLN